MALVLIATAALAGCKKESAEPPTATRWTSSATTAPSTAPATGKATIRGKVVFDGTPPAMPEISTATDPSCGGHAIKQETVVVNTNGTLKNVVVSLKAVSAGGVAAEPGPTAATAAAAAVVDQIGCRYVPHVVAIRAGGSVVFKSSDPTLHNVHVLSEKGAAMNRALTGAGQAMPPVRFAGPEFVRVKCDVHPWMQCWVAVVDSPFFAVTDEKGEFEIKDVPPGTYTVQTWHERYGPMSRPAVTVAAGQAVDVTFTVKGP